MNCCCKNCGWSETYGSPIMCNYTGHRTWRDECCEAWKPKEQETQPEIVRCKDCKWRGNKEKCIVAFVADKQDFPLFFYDNRGEWFCADGEPKDGEQDGT